MTNEWAVFSLRVLTTMPTYEYECANCGHFEYEQSMSSKPLGRCPKCRSRRIDRLISATSFRLKGGGWYAQGYQKGSGGKDSSGGGDKGPDKAGDKVGDKAADKGGSKSGDKGASPGAKKTP